MAETDESADGGSWSGVERVANTSEAALVVGFLRNHDIPARVLDKSFHQTPTSGEDLSPIEIAVPSDRVDDARQALEKREAVYAASSEGDTVMTDDGPAEIDTSAAPDGERNE